MSGGWLPPSEAPEPDRPAREQLPGQDDGAVPAAPAYASWPGAQPAAEGPEPWSPGGPTPTGWWPRAGAAVVDFLVRLALGFVVGLIFGFGVGAAGGDDIDAVSNLAGLLGLLLGWTYATVMIARNNGQPLGHMATSTRIVKADGTPLGAGMAFVREGLVKGILFDIIGVLLILIPFLLNYLWPLWDKNNEALHDKICGTRVVKA